MFLGYKFLWIILVLSAFIFNCEGTDEDVIKALSNTFAESYNAHNAEKLSSLWSDDGIFANLNTNTTIQGRDDLIQYFKDQFEKARDANLKITINRINFPEPNQANVKGKLQILQKDKPAENNVFKADYVKINDSWKLQIFKQFTLPSPNSNFAHLEDLSWVIGDWIDQDEDIETLLSFRWDKNKNFIIQIFNMKILGMDYLDGHQIIGWDPIKNKIRAWIFDTEGGFGESTWTKDGNKWYVTTTFTLSGGQRGSSTQVYTREDDNTYTFSSVARDIDGIIQPNIGPFKIVRKPASNGGIK